MTLIINDLTVEEERAMQASIRKGLLAATGGSGMVNSNFALAVFINGLLMLSSLGADRAWFTTALDVYLLDALPQGAKFFGGKQVLSPEAGE